MELTGVETGAIGAFIGTVGTGMATAIKVLWKRVTEREDREIETYKKLIEKNNRLVRENNQLKTEMIGVMELVVERLDEFAAVIETLDISPPEEPGED